MPGWNKLSYEELMTQYNNKRVNNNIFNCLNINLKKGDLVCVDIDDENLKDEYLSKYGNKWMSKSTGRGLPHIYYKKDENDSGSTKIQIEPGLDLLYQNVFEWKDAVIENTTEEMGVFKLFDQKSPEIKEKLPKQTKYVFKEIKVETPKCSEEEFRNHIKSFKPRYKYDEWLNIGIICYNNFDGSDIGLNIWNEYSKDDDENYCGKKELRKKYLSFNQKSQNKLSYKQFIRWHEEDFPCKNRFESWYKQGLDVFIENCNKEMMYYSQTSDIIYFNNSGDFLLNKHEKASKYYAKYTFYVTDNQKRIEINPFNVWYKNIDRRDVDEIVFDPSKNHNNDQFNIWKDYEYQPTGAPDLSKIQHWLDHIKEILADGDEERYEYILNWFAQFIQNPHKKNNVCLVFHSIEGVGKTVIVDKIGEIMGHQYYYRCSKLKNILGDFNSKAEGRILVNLNETTWGGDKKMTGAFKEFITDNTISITKKGKEPYEINNFANTVITTNEEWIIDIKSDSRRFNLMECSEKLYNADYYKKLAEVDPQEVANFLYNRDLTGYNPRNYKKSALYQEQLEINFDSVETFLKNLYEEELVVGDLVESIPGVKINDEGWINKKDFYDFYRYNVSGSFEKVFNNVGFWKKYNKILPSTEYGQFNRVRKIKFDLMKFKTDYKNYYKL